jgi:hypothetical protein
MNDLFLVKRKRRIEFENFLQKYLEKTKNEKKVVIEEEIEKDPIQLAEKYKLVDDELSILEKKFVNIHVKDQNKKSLKLKHPFDIFNENEELDKDVKIFITKYKPNKKRKLE